MLQAVVAHDHIAARTHQQLRRGRPVAPDRDRHAGAPREQDGLIADPPGSSDASITRTVPEEPP